MAGLITHNDRGSLITRRSIVIGAAVSLIWRSCHRLRHKSHAGTSLTISVWTSICGVHRPSISSLDRKQPHSRSASRADYHRGW
jgi:hypothetical protein